MTRPARTLLGLAALALLAGAPPRPAAAELLQCRGPDGRVIFTDKPERCPGAKPYEPAAKIQKAPSRAPSGPPASAQPRARRDLSDEAERAMAASWAQKKRNAEDELEQILARQDYLQSFVAHCNRGGLVLQRDEAGIKHTVDCDALRQEMASLDAREAEVREYLQSGLADECRRAGCLPGWIR